MYIMPVTRRSEMDYDCPRCGYTTPNKTHYLQHMLRKKTLCQPFLSEMTQLDMAEYCNKTINELHEYKHFTSCSKKPIDHPFVCHFCDNSFGSSSGRSKHIFKYHPEVAPVKPNITQTDNHSMNSTYTNSSNITTINNAQHTVNNINNTNTTNHIHVTLRGFGDENMDYIGEEARKQYLTGGIRGIVEMMDHVFFNDEHPENHNVQMKSTKLKLVQVYKPPQWKLEPLSETAAKMFDKVRTAIQLLLEVLPESVAERVKCEIFTENKTTSRAMARAQARLISRRANAASKND